METQAYWEQLINRSVSRLFLLAALAQEPMHGYQIGKTVEQATGACCTPSAAMIYPALRELVEGGFITCEVERTGTRERKVCTLTPKGRQVYETAAKAWQRVLPSIHQAVQGALLSDQAGQHGSQESSTRVRTGEPE